MCDRPKQLNTKIDLINSSSWSESLELIKDKKCDYVLEELVKAGAPKEIKYEAKPHVGTDILKDVVKNIRKQIQIYFLWIIYSTSL